jgi:hypothetical protein
MRVLEILEQLDGAADWRGVAASSIDMYNNDVGKKSAINL